MFSYVLPSLLLNISHILDSIILVTLSLFHLYRAYLIKSSTELYIQYMYDVSNKNVQPHTHEDLHLIHICKSLQYDIF